MNVKMEQVPRAVQQRHQEPSLRVVAARQAARTHYDHRWPVGRQLGQPHIYQQLIADDIL